MHADDIWGTAVTQRATAAVGTAACSTRDGLSSAACCGDGSSSDSDPSEDELHYTAEAAGEVSGTNDAKLRRERVAKFNKAAYLAAWKEHVASLAAFKDPEFDLVHGIFSKSTAIAGFDLFRAFGLDEQQSIIRQDWNRQWAAHGKYQYAVSECTHFFNRMLRPRRVNELTMAHAGWPLTGKVQSQSGIDDVQEITVHATKSNMPASLAPSRYADAMERAGMNANFLSKIRSTAMTALHGKPPRETKRTIRSRVSREVALWLGVLM